MPVSTTTSDLPEPLGGRVVEVRLSGKLTKADYEAFVPSLERDMERPGKLRLLVILSDFDGWTAGALWQDIKFDVKHFNDIDRLAIVGDERWEEGMAKFCSAFTGAEVRFFPLKKVPTARRWLQVHLEAGELEAADAAELSTLSDDESEKQTNPS